MMQQLSFLADAPPDHRIPGEPIARDALIEGNYRRWLKRRWGAGPLIGWGMLNPATADGQRDDMTLWRIMGFSYRWGYGGLVVGNIYPFISANPAAMRRWLSSFRGGGQDSSAQAAYARNFRDCAELLSECAFHMAAWGNGAARTDVDHWLAMVAAEAGREIAWHCLGTTADGSPKHPLARGRHRVPDEQKPTLWRRV